MTKYWGGPWQWSDLGVFSHYHSPVGSIALVDLRNQETQSVANNAAGVGNGFFATADDIDLGADYSLLGQGYITEVQTNNSVRSAWQALFGVLPRGSFLVDYLAYNLTDGSDPTGVSGPLPLDIMSPSGESVIELGGHSVVWRRSPKIRQGGGQWGAKLRSEIKSRIDRLIDLDNDSDLWRKNVGWLKMKHGQRWDDPDESWIITPKMIQRGIGNGHQSYARKPATAYTENWPTDGAPQTSQNQAWTAQTGFTTGCTISSGQFTTQTGGIEYRAKMDSAVSGHDNRAYVTWKGYGDNAGTSQHNPMCRVASGSTQTFYIGYCQNASGTKSILLYKFVTGTPTSLASSSTTLSTDDTFGVSANGSTITSIRNGSALSSVTDTAITTGTLGGIGGYSTCVTTQATSDTWIFEDIPTGHPALRRFGLCRNFGSPVGHESVRYF